MMFAQALLLSALAAALIRECAKGGEHNICLRCAYAFALYGFAWAKPGGAWS